MAVYAPDFFELGENRVAAPAMDDRCACALLCEMLMYLDETPQHRGGRVSQHPGGSGLPRRNDRRLQRGAPIWGWRWM